MQTNVCPCLKSFQCLDVECTMMCQNKKKNANAKSSQLSDILVIKLKNRCSPSINIKKKEQSL